ncbi:MAG: aminoglycoside phosphotransferase family protein [Chloroflexota bacterium]
MDQQLSQDIHTYLATASSSEFCQQEVEILEGWEGSENLLWQVQSNGQEAVLKLFLDAGQARSRRQYDGQQSFASLGIAPRPLWFDRYPHGLARQVLVYEWMPGELLNPAESNGMLSLAQSIAQIHSGDPNDVRRFSPNPVNLDYFWRVQQGSFGPIHSWLNDHNGHNLSIHFSTLAERAETLVEAALPLWSGSSPAPVHGDLKLENCLSHFGSTALLDWELFGIGDPALDVARFLHFSQQEIAEEMAESWLDHYLSMADQPGLAQRIGVFQRLLIFQSLCYILDGLRSAEADLFADEETVAFLQATLSATLAASSNALGAGNDVDTGMAVDQLKFAIV